MAELSHAAIARAGIDEREQATIDLTKRLATTGVWAVRVHSVKPHKEVLAQ